MTLYRTILFLFCISFLIIPSISSPAITIDVAEPRQYGYILGDVFTRKITLNSIENYSVLLDKKKYIGRINNWLSIRKVDSKKLSNLIYSIEIQYQVVNVPSKPSMVVVPAFEIKTINGGVKEKLMGPELLVTLAPITPEVVTNRGGLLNMQPNKLTPEIDTGNIISRMIIWLSLFTVPILIFAYAWTPWQKLFFTKKLPFSIAYSKVLKLKNLPSLDFWREGLTLMHFALNETAKKTVFTGSLDEFFFENVKYQKLSKETQYLFKCSRSLFYGNETLPKNDDKKILIELLFQFSLAEKNLD